MTLADLVSEIKFEAKIENDTDWSNHIYRFISDEASALAVENKDALLLVSQHSLSSSDQDATSKLVRLPTNFLLGVEVRFRTATPVEWILPSRAGLVPPPMVAGKPKAYDFYGSELASSQAFKSSIRLLPDPYTLLANEKVLVTYYRQPFEEVTPSTTGTTVIYPFSWLGELKKRVVVRIHTYNVGSLSERAQLLNQSIDKTRAQIVPEEINPTKYAATRNA